MTKRSVPFAVATVLMTMNQTLPASAKPIAIAEGVTFDLEACRRTQDGADIICTGTFFSRSGERRITIERDYMVWGKTYITTPQGKTHVSSEISVGPEQVCKFSDDQFSYNSCGLFSITLVENVRYTSSFLFRDVSPNTSKIALLEISIGNRPFKYRNLSV